MDIFLTNVTSMAMSPQYKTPQSGQVNLFKIFPTVTIYKTYKPNPINQVNSINGGLNIEQDKPERFN